jgi:hypothetical protein
VYGIEKWQGWQLNACGSERVSELPQLHPGNGVAGPGKEYPPPDIGIGKGEDFGASWTVFFCGKGIGYQKKEAQREKGELYSGRMSMRRHVNSTLVCHNIIAMMCTNRKNFTI